MKFFFFLKKKNDNFILFYFFMKKMITLFDHTFMPITIMYFYTKIMRELYTNFMIGLLSYFLC